MVTLRKETQQNINKIKAKWENTMGAKEWELGGEGSECRQDQLI